MIQPLQIGDFWGMGEEGATVLAGAIPTLVVGFGYAVKTIWKTSKRLDVFESYGQDIKDLKRDVQAIMRHMGVEQDTVIEPADGGLQDR
jgi:hypothetical protein